MAMYTTCSTLELMADSYAKLLPRALASHVAPFMSSTSCPNRMPMSGKVVPEAAAPMVPSVMRLMSIHVGWA